MKFRYQAPTALRRVLYAATASMILLLPSCKKKFQETQTNNAPSGFQKKMTEGEATNDYVFGPENATEGYRYTVLGRQYGPVFNVENVRNAWQELSGEAIDIQPTHLYIRFDAQNIDQLKTLMDADLATYTFPLDYEIVEAGDYMQDPAAEPNGIPPLYTCIPAGQPIPEVPHEVLSQLYLLDMRSVVARKAFELAGEAENYPGPEEGEVVPDVFTTTNAGLAVHANTSLDWSHRLTTDVIPGPAEMLMPNGPATNINSAPITVTNSCNCDLNNDDRKPSGCIKVEETQWWDGNVRFEGVNDIMADFIGPFFQRLSPMTNQYGCYKDNRIMRYKVWRPFGGTIKLPVIMSAIFVSAKKTIKGLNHTNIMEYAAPMTHCIWSVQGGGLNHVNITYLRDWNTDHNETKYYTGATANNAIYDFDGYAAQDGIQGTMSNLKVMVHKYGDAGSAPMFHKLLASGSIPAITIAAFVAASVGAIPVVGSTGIGGVIVAFPPDVTLGYKYTPTMQNFTTDKLKETAYHEYAHVIHYRKAGNNLWENNINYIAHYGLGSNPYGSASNPGSTRTDLIEMWGYYLGPEYAHRRYGPNRHSLSSSPVFSNSWYFTNESQRLVWSHIPGGFLQDIRDNNGYNSAFGLSENGLVNDAISNFSNATIYNQMGSGTTTASQLINTLGGMLPAGNTAAGYTNLKTSYGY